VFITDCLLLLAELMPVLQVILG